ncbi:DNA internalization-related competence protein ComEC/Rec2 [Lentibacillus salicampi]|uniref:DNA internalization-related competence protein ComEC/Rec2 n=1 Tax=Lentibacillus salicampi TaxID=175306 RepID=A0A4Y9ADT8_9BACI|nr:DNA internalization-related competence protein ComEC/Rec2 [Lentibacillus salicampi]TFJ94058.1 DNA internalization-related competence protein ComEC/Rec2 [Lentibacillus salicampi]
MKGYWHVPALGIAVSFLAVIFENIWFLAVFFLWLLYLYYDQRLGKIAILISLTCSIFAYTYIPELEVPQEDEAFTSHQSTFTGQITSPISESEARIGFELKDEESDRKWLIVYFKDDQDGDHDLKHGASCTIYGQPELPEEGRNPGQFDYQKYLLGQGITYQITVDSLESLDCSGSSFLNNIYQLRSRLIQFVQDEISPETAAWLNALVLGDDAQIDEETTELFQRWNLSHILAISGLHVGLLVGLFYFLLVKMNILTKEKAQWVMIFFLPFYALIAGGEPSVLRASAMVLLFMLANKMNWKFSVTDVLSIVFIMLTLLDPYMLYHIGFQLSFSVTLGLLLSKNWLSQTSISFFSILKISFVSQMIILPLQVEYFYTFQPLSILLNLIIVPYFTMFVIPLMFFMLLLAPMAGFLISYIDRLFVHIHEVFMVFIQFIDQTLYYPLVIGSFPLAAAIVYYVLFLILMEKLERKQQKQAFKLGCYLTALLIIIVIKPYFSPTGHVTMLDIGQGDAIVIELPYRKGVIFIDAGAKVAFDSDEPSDNIFKQVIQPYLYSRGISKVDTTFISHADTDHMGSLQYMAESGMVDNVVVSQYYAFSENVTEVLADIGTEVIRASQEEAVTIGGQTFYVLGPIRDKQSANENSLVLYTAIGGKSWLFTGDIDSDTERELLNRYPELHADVLKVAHHGSKTSTDPVFLQKLQPIYGLISVGENNTYGHPHASVMNALKEANISIIRTDQNGAIQYHFSESEGTFSTFLP